MCGISGFWQVEKPPREKEAIIGAMMAALRHRGPDGGQFFSDDYATLGHRRLSIIAPDASADQPMRRGPLTIVYNGELYNYRAEKSRLEASGVTFKTQSDTEVLLALYEREGTDCFQRLNGIFSFAIYDESKRRLVCARDHFGIKPFLYKQSGASLIFASELKSLLASGLVAPEIDHAAVSLLLQTGSVPQPYTMLAEVKSLLPGHFIVCEGAAIRIEKYYQLKAADIVCASDDEWQDAVHQSLRQAVSDQMVADVPIGAFLSGGVDSGLIAALMKESSAQVKTYSVGFETKNSGQYDETSEAAEVARYLGTDHQAFIISDQEAKTALAPVIAGLDHPTIDGLNSYFVSQVTAKEVRVALSGTGADEIFAGYAWFGAMQDYENASLLQRIKHQLRGRDFLTYYQSLHRVFTPAQAGLLLRDKFIAGERYLPQILKDLSVGARTSELVIGSFLQNQLLPDIDTASMAHGLEVRVPYLSRELVELGLALPDHLKIGKATAVTPAGSYAAEGTKKILVDIARTYLPQGFDTRPKRGFAMPMARWMQTIWNDEISEAFSFESVTRRGLFNPAAVARLQQTNAPWTQIWLLLAVELWCRQVLDTKGHV